MKKASALIIIISAGLISFCGCDSSKNSAAMPQTGFLSDYSMLRPVSGTSWRYMNPKVSVKNYTRFIIEPVELYLDDKSKASVGSLEEPEKLKEYMRNALIDALEPRYVAIGAVPGPRTAKIRVAITNLKKGSAVGMGGATLEAEFLDSQTGEQLAAFVETRKERRAFGAFSEWDDAKAVMDDFAQRLYDRLEESRY